MSETFNKSYFSVLPNEILIKILSDVDIATILNFCEIFGCDYFLKDRNVIKTVTLYRQYMFENITEISEKMASEHITTLNINCVYWIQAFKLRKIIARMVNLETLYAIQTNLSLTQADTCIFSKLKIKKLGISLKKNDEFGRGVMSSVETLYLGVFGAEAFLHTIAMYIIFPHLQQLWVNSERSTGRELNLHCLNLSGKIKLFCQIYTVVPNINLDHFLLSAYYANRRMCQPYTVCFEKFSQSERDTKNKTFFDLESQLVSWSVLKELHCLIPYGPKDARRLFLGENTLDDIFFEELNFHHSGPVCVERCREAIKEILKSPSAKKLKGLCIMNCLFNDKKGEYVSVPTSNSFKRKRVGLETKSVSHPVEDIFKNFLLLQHLEIFSCPQLHFKPSHYNAIQGYPVIALFTHLRSLTIEVPSILDGSFLSDVLKNCKILEILKIISKSPNEKLNINVCNSIVLASSLKDFKYENRHILLDRLLENLASIKSQKLQRIVLIAKEVDKFSAAPLELFLNTNPQLIFLYFLLTECTEISLRKAQETLNTYKKKNPLKIFLVKKRDVFGGPGYPIPDVHYYEMMKTDSDVAGLRPLDDFMSF